MKTSPLAGAFSRVGLSTRQAFSHDVAIVPKCYPDSILHLLQHNIPKQTIKSDRFRQVNVYANDIEKYPDALFSDPNINWHGQQCGRAGLVAAAGVFLPDQHKAIVTTLQSDLCQQLYRHPQLKRNCKTQVDTRFGKWYRLLINAIVDFCVDNDIMTLYIPTSDTVLKRLPKLVSAALFRRVYDDPSLWLRCARSMLEGAEYWEIAILSNRQFFVALEQAPPISKKELRGLCIFHDIERDVDTPVSINDCDSWLNTMLNIESSLGLSLTYSVLGTILPALKRRFESHNIHSFALHSFDHQVNSTSQLRQVRQIDCKARGYRPPQSKITPELTDLNLAFHNFEWLLSSASSLGVNEPTLHNNIVKIPVHLDDYSLHVGEYSFDDWMAHLDMLLRSDIPLVVVGLHDCYAGEWIGQYRRILEESMIKQRLWNCDDIASMVYYNALI